MADDASFAHPLLEEWNIGIGICQKLFHAVVDAPYRLACRIGRLVCIVSSRLEIIRIPYVLVLRRPETRCKKVGSTQTGSSSQENSFNMKPHFAGQVGIKCRYGKLSFENEWRRTCKLPMFTHLHTDCLHTDYSYIILLHFIIIEPRLVDYSSCSPHACLLHLNPCE